jgi:hypothetical protein
MTDKYAIQDVLSQYVRANRRGTNPTSHLRRRASWVTPGRPATESTDAHTHE